VEMKKRQSQNQQLNLIFEKGDETMHHPMIE
jgi:hypothetical protein